MEHLHRIVGRLDRHRRLAVGDLEVAGLLARRVLEGDHPVLGAVPETRVGPGGDDHVAAHVDETVLVLQGLVGVLRSDHRVPVREHGHRVVGEVDHLLAGGVDVAPLPRRRVLDADEPAGGDLELRAVFPEVSEEGVGLNDGVVGIQAIYIDILIRPYGLSVPVEKSEGLAALMRRRAIPLFLDDVEACALRIAYLSAWDAFRQCVENVCEAVGDLARGVHEAPGVRPLLLHQGVVADEAIQVIIVSIRRPRGQGGPRDLLEGERQRSRGRAAGREGRAAQGHQERHEQEPTERDAHGAGTSDCSLRHDGLPSNRDGTICA